EKLLQQEQWAYLNTHPSKRFDSFYYDDEEEDYTLAVTPVLSTEEPDNSLRGIEASNDNPVPFYDLIIYGTPSNLTPSGASDFFLEVYAFLAVEDEPTSS
nr:hypothetical protein [Tanacetum cinerariifolium]